MLTSILIFLLYVVIAVIIVEIIFWIIGMILPVSPRIRGLLYALALLIILIMALHRFAGLAI